MKKYFIIALSLLLVCCTSTIKTEIHQVNRNKVVIVKEKLTEIIADEAVLGGRSRSYIVNDYFIHSV